MMLNIEKGTEPSRGYFDRIEYLDGNLVIDGWMLVPKEHADKILLFIDKQFIREFDIIEKPDVAKAFPFIPHARYSGFAIAEKLYLPADKLSEICIVAMRNDKQIGHMKTCFSKKAADKLIVRDKHLMHRVAHTESVSYFRASGFKSFYDFWEPACKHTNPTRIKTVLDWGAAVEDLLNCSSF